MLSYLVILREPLKLVFLVYKGFLPKIGQKWFKKIFFKNLPSNIFDSNKMFSSSRWYLRLVLVYITEYHFCQRII